MTTHTAAPKPWFDEEFTYHGARCFIWQDKDGFRFSVRVPGGDSATMGQIESHAKAKTYARLFYWYERGERLKSRPE